MKNSKDRFQFNGTFKEYEDNFSEQFKSEAWPYIRLCYDMSLLPSVAISLY